LKKVLLRFIIFIIVVSLIISLYLWFEISSIEPEICTTGCDVKNISQLKTYFNISVISIIVSVNLMILLKEPSKKHDLVDNETTKDETENEENEKYDVDKTLFKTDIATKISRETTLTIGEAYRIVGIIFDVCTEVLKSGENISIARFGGFTVTQSKSKTESDTEIEALIDHNIVSFNASKILINLMNIVENAEDSETDSNKKEIT